MTTTEHLRRQRGVALLFALGLLSLMLVMGVAFLGNALIARKMAVNTNESASARQLGRSVVDRALTHLTLLALAQNSQAAGMYASDAGSVFSRLSAGTFGGKADFTDNEAGRIFRDGIYTHNAAESLLPLTAESGTADGLPRSQAEWIYLHKNGDESNGLSDTQTANPIIARYAYQFLPQSSPSRLSLFAVTSGSRKGGIEYAVKAGTATITRRPQLYRWGVEADELIIPGLDNMFSTYWKYQLESGTPGDSLCAPAYEFNNFIGILSGDKSPNPFFGASNAVKDKKNWLRHIFAEGRARISREAYFDGKSQWFPRFNLGDASGDDVWYSRFLKDDETPADIKNSNTVVERLGAVAPETDNKDYLYSDGFPDDSKYKHPIGLPFLRAIGSETEKPSFLKPDGTADMASFRKQIAANLNDYCDSDSTPTSDVPAGEWKNANTDSSKVPSYTGNEKTPYINEIAFGFKLNEAKLPNGAQYRFTGKVYPEIIAELINVYKRDDGVVNPAAGCTLSGKLKYLSLTFKVSMKGTVTATRRRGDETKDESFPIDDNMEQEIVIYDSGKAQDFTITGFTGSGPYWVKNHQFPAPTADNITMDLTSKLWERGKDEGKLQDGDVVTNYSVSYLGGGKYLKVEITKMTFDLGHLILTDSTESGIDFVKSASPTGTAKGYELSLASQPATHEPLFGENLTSADDLTTRTSGDNCIFLLGSVQAIDPRQNLNLNFEQMQTRQNDWFRTQEPSLDTANMSSWSWSSLDSRITGGKVNVNSNPGAPKYADGTACVCDTETEGTIDPAWQGDEPGQHISTAVIRNKPMRSPWELGFIHRAIPFQTINLKKAGGTEDDATLAEDAHHPKNFVNWTEETGTRYQYGDAGILDQIKMTEYNKSYGKVDMSTLRNTTIPGVGSGDISSLNKQIFVSLFEGIRTQLPWQFLKESDDSKTPLSGDSLTPCKGSDFPLATAADFGLGSIPETQLRSKVINGLQSVFNVTDGINDAAKEEIIGKTVNLMEGKSCSFPNVFRVMVVVQTIRDLEGNVSRLDSASPPVAHPKTAVTGKFDADIKGKSVDAVYADRDSSIYYDEILSECRMLATIERITYMEGDNPRVKFRVKQIEYLD